MAGIAVRKDTIRKNTVEKMKKMGTYKPEYDDVIGIYAELLEQYRRLTQEYQNGGYRYEESTADGGAKKSPIVSTLEALRRDILQYSDRLKLNPKSNEMKGTGQKKKTSALADALSSIEA